MQFFLCFAILGATKSASEVLPSTNVDLCKVVDTHLVDALQDSFGTIRYGEGSFSSIWQWAVDNATDSNHGAIRCK